MSSGVRILTHSFLEAGHFGLIDTSLCSVSGLGNLVDGRCGKVMRITPASASRCSVRIGANLDESQLVDSFALGNISDMPDGATVEVHFFENTNYQGDAISRQVLYEPASIQWGAGSLYAWRAPPPGNVYVFFDAPFEFRSFQVDIAMTFGAGYASRQALVGRILAGHAFSPRVGYAPGASITRVDESRHDRTAGDSLYGNVKRPWRRFKMSMNHLAESDRKILDAQLASAGKAADMLVALDDEATGQELLDKTLIGRRGNNAMFARANAPWYQSSLVVDETCAAPIGAAAQLAIRTGLLAQDELGQYAPRAITLAPSGQTVAVSGQGSLLARHLVSDTAQPVTSLTMKQVTDGIEFAMNINGADTENLTAPVAETPILFRLYYGAYALDVPGPAAGASPDSADPYTWTVTGADFVAAIAAMLAQGASRDAVLTWLPGVASKVQLEPSAFVYPGEGLSVEMTTAYPYLPYMALSNDTMWQLDLVTPANSAVISGSYPSGLNNIVAIAGHNGTLYAINDGATRAELWVLNISNLSASYKVGNFSFSLVFGSEIRTALVSHNNKLYIVHQARVYEVDTTTPANSTQKSGVISISGHSNTVSGASEFNGSVYATNNAAGIFLLDLETPANSTLQASVPSNQQTIYGLVPFADNLYMIRDSQSIGGTIEVYRVTSLSNLSLSVKTGQFTIPSNVSIYGCTLFGG